MNTEGFLASLGMTVLGLFSASCLDAGIFLATGKQTLASEEASYNFSADER
jgi:hypothetical protein